MREREKKVVVCCFLCEIFEKTKRKKLCRSECEFRVYSSKKKERRQFSTHVTCVGPEVISNEIVLVYDILFRNGCV